MILTFFTTYTDDTTLIEVYDKKRIAVHYLKFWFWIDLVSIFPFEQIGNLFREHDNTSRLAKAS